MPDLPPPNGTPIREVFQVISIARPVTSPESLGVMRMPPFDGPNTSLCRTRNTSACNIWPSGPADESRDLFCRLQHTASNIVLQVESLDGLPGVPQGGFQEPIRVGCNGHHRFWVSIIGFSGGFSVGFSTLHDSLNHTRGRGNAEGGRGLSEPPGLSRRA